MFSFQKKNEKQMFFLKFFQNIKMAKNIFFDKQAIHYLFLSFGEQDFLFSLFFQIVHLFSSKTIKFP